MNKLSSSYGERPKGTACPAIDGILKEGKEIAGEVAEKKVLDAALITAAQAVEHYEITRYGTLIAWAKEIGNGCGREAFDHHPQRGKNGRQETDCDRETGMSIRRLSTDRHRTRGYGMNARGEQTRSLWMKVEVYPDAPRFSGSKAATPSSSDPELQGCPSPMSWQVWVKASSSSTEGQFPAA